jgi:hypothetical protein
MRFVVDRNVVMRRIPVYGLKCYQIIFWSQSLSMYPVAIVSGHLVTVTDMVPCFAIICWSCTPDAHLICLVHEACNALGVIEWVTCTVVAMLRVASDIDTIVGRGSVLCEVRGNALETDANRGCNNVAEPDGSSVINELNALFAL